MNNTELLAHLRRRLIDARINTFDGGQTLRFFHGQTGSVTITSEWGDPSLYELLRAKRPELFPEDDPTVIDQPVVMETY